MQDSIIEDLVASSKRILLVEPPYKRKYPPLGLMKLATYAKRMGKTVTFSRGVPLGKWDLVCVATVFTSDLPIVRRTLNEISVALPDVPVLIGGIAASILPDSEFVHEGISNVFVFKGFSKLLDSCPPDYSIDWGVDDKIKEISFLFTSRGCSNKCAYCFVPKIESELGVIPNWEEHIDLGKPIILYLDNNLTCFGTEHIEKLARFPLLHKKRVRTEGGFYCRSINDDTVKAISKIPFLSPRGMRLSFDRIADDGHFQKAVELLKAHGVSRHALQAYVLFNYKDHPQEANYRARECVNVGITPYPQRFQPMSLLKRRKGHVSDKWTEKLCVAFHHFWLVRGLYEKDTFENWMQGYGKNVYHLREEDWEKWYDTPVTYRAEQPTGQRKPKEAVGLFY